MSGITQCLDDQGVPPASRLLRPPPLRRRDRGRLLDDVDVKNVL
jgi:hypothetical protein